MAHLSNLAPAGEELRGRPQARQRDLVFWLFLVISVALHLMMLGVLPSPEEWLRSVGQEMVLTFLDEEPRPLPEQKLPVPTAVPTDPALPTEPPLEQKTKLTTSDYDPSKPLQERFTEPPGDIPTKPAPLVAPPSLEQGSSAQAPGGGEPMTEAFLPTLAPVESTAPPAEPTLAPEPTSAPTSPPGAVTPRSEDPLEGPDPRQTPQTELASAAEQPRKPQPAPTAKPEQGLPHSAFFKQQPPPSEATGPATGPGKGSSLLNPNLRVPEEFASRSGGTAIPGSPFSFEVMNAPGYNIYPYAMAMKTRFQSNWHVPSIAYTGAKGAAAFTFGVLPDGTVVDLNLSATTGNRAYEHSARMAIELSNPLPKLPEDFPEDILLIRFTFFYNMRPQ